MHVNQQMLVHKNKYKDILMQKSIVLPEVHYLLPFLVNMINKLLKLLHIIHIKMVYII